MCCGYDRVTEPGGTATLARVPGFSVGGKTGTVHKVGSGGYLDDQYIALFVGIAPLSAPRYVTAILTTSHGATITEAVWRRRRSIPVSLRKSCGFAMRSPSNGLGCR